ncbi:hypothetical protein B0H11DRAFT_2223865 [Mycena galericulata]|nr:hypothetical protein B0H11DRAFT_2223865 [Mycena galericulata]
MIGAEGNFRGSTHGVIRSVLRPFRLNHTLIDANNPLGRLSSACRSTISSLHQAGCGLLIALVIDEASTSESGMVDPRHPREAHMSERMFTSQEKLPRACKIVDLTDNLEEIREIRASPQCTALSYNRRCFEVVFQQLEDGIRVFGAGVVD